MHNVQQALNALSLARTALADPTGLPIEDFRSWRDGEANEYVIGRIDDAMRLLDPDDEARRTVLVHLNVDAPAWDDRSAEQIADAILGAIEVGSDDESMSGLIVAVALAEDA